MSGRRAAALLAALAALLAAEPASAAPSDAREKRLQAALDDFVATKVGPPGISVVLRRGGEETFLTAGVADVDSGRAFKRRARMRLASVSKAYSANVALQLVDGGALSLDESITARVPSLPAAWSAVTLRQLLAHTSGVPDFTGSQAFRDTFVANPTAIVTKQQLVDFVADQPLVHPPGTVYEYSNTDNIIVAMMVEAATGEPYATTLRKLVARPLGLRRTKLPDGPSLQRPFIHGYELFPLEDLSECCSASWSSASGGMVSTPAEQTTFIGAHAGGRLLTRETKAAQRTFIRGGSSEPPGPGKNAAGLGIFRYRLGCGTVLGHTGNTTGYTQYSAATRNGRRAVTVSVNRQITPEAAGQGAARAFKTLRKIFKRATCTALG